MIIYLAISQVKIASFFITPLLSFVFLATCSWWLLGLEWRKGSQVNLLLRWSSHQKLGSVHQVLADADVALVDQDTGLMDALGLEAFLIDSGLESLVQEFIDSQTQDVIEFEFFIAKESISVHSVQQCSAFENSSGVSFFKSEQLSGGFSELGEQ